MTESISHNIISTVPPRVAVIGCGYWGANLVRNMHRTGNLAMVIDTTVEGRARAAAITACTPVLDDISAALECPEIDAVMIATPAVTHAELATRSLLAGKHTFCEKPVAIHYDEGENVVRLARRSGLIFMIGHLLEYHPAIAAIESLIAGGAIGRIHYIYSNRLNLGKIRREENILWSFAPHDIALILRFVGLMPREVIAAGGSYLRPGIADVTVTQLLFESGLRSHIFVSWLHPFKEQRLVIVGEKNIISFDDVAKKLILHHQHVDVDCDLNTIPVRGDGEEIAFDATEPLALECRAFVDAVASGCQPVTDGASALRVLAVLDAAHRSLAADGAVVRL